MSFNIPPPFPAPAAPNEWEESTSSTDEQDGSSSDEEVLSTSFRSPQNYIHPRSKTLIPALSPASSLTRSGPTPPTSSGYTPSPEPIRYTASIPGSARRTTTMTSHESLRTTEGIIRKSVVHHPVVVDLGEVDIEEDDRDSLADRKKKRDASSSDDEFDDLSPASIPASSNPAIRGSGSADVSISLGGSVDTTKSPVALAQRVLVTEGWLLKLGVVTIPGFEWKQRWFTLYSDFSLSWSKQRRGRRKLGVIDLKRAELPDERLFNSTMDLTITFVITTTTRTYFLKEPDPSLHAPSKADWIKAIHSLNTARRYTQIAENNMRLTAALEKAPLVPGSFSTHHRHKENLNELYAVVTALQRELVNEAPENWIAINKLVRGRFCTVLGTILSDCIFKESLTSSAKFSGRFASIKQPLWHVFQAAKDPVKMRGYWDEELATAVEWIQNDYRSFGDPNVMFRSLVSHALNERMLTRWFHVVLNAPKIAHFFPDPDAFYNNLPARRSFFTILERISLFHFHLDVGFEFHKTILPTKGALIPASRRFKFNILPSSVNHADIIPTSPKSPRSSIFSSSKSSSHHHSSPSLSSPPSSSPTSPTSTRHPLSPSPSSSSSPTSSSSSTSSTPNPNFTLSSTGQSSPRPTVSSQIEIQPSSTPTSTSSPRSHLSSSSSSIESTKQPAQLIVQTHQQFDPNHDLHNDDDDPENMTSIKL